MYLRIWSKKWSSSFRISVRPKSFSCLGGKKHQDLYRRHRRQRLLQQLFFFFNYHCSSCHATANEFLYFIEYGRVYTYMCVCFCAFDGRKEKYTRLSKRLVLWHPYIVCPKGSIILGVAICCDGFITDLPIPKEPEDEGNILYLPIFRFCRLVVEWSYKKKYLPRFILKTDWNYDSRGRGIPRF